MVSRVGEALPRVPPDSGPELAEKLVRMRHVIDLAELSFAQLASDFANTEEYDAWGSVSAIDWIRIHCHMTSSAAADRVRVGDHLEQLSESVDAMAMGEIGFAHISVLARTADALPDSFRESDLLDKAKEVSPGRFFHQCRHYRHAADPKGFESEQSELYENRHLALSLWEDGSLLLHGALDPVGGAALRTALAPLARKSGAGDDRNLEQRQADALVELAMGGQRTQLQVTSSLETLQGLLGAPAAELELTLPISAKTVERLACDCSITRILLQDSVVIDVGRARRTVEGPARRALNARDGHCRWPGCERPPSRSAAHHLVHWNQGGGSELDNLVLLCHRHHRLVHEGGWQIVRGEDGRLLTVPPTVTFGSLARGPD
jgi:Domain of unknown function (DUF222)/HNH endonuclease